MEIRSAGSNNFARLSNDLIAYRASEPDLEVNGGLSSYPRMHLSSYDDGHNSSSSNGPDAASRAGTMKYDRRHNSASTGTSVGGDSARLWPQSQLGQEARKGATLAHSTTSSRRGQNANRPPTGAAAAAGEVRTSCLVKSSTGFGFTLADTPTGHMVKLMAEPLGSGHLQPGDVIVMIDGIDARRQSHENTVAMLKSYPPGSTVTFNYIRPNDAHHNHHPRPHSAIPRSSFYPASNPLQSSPMNGGGRRDDGGTDWLYDHRTTTNNHRTMLTTHPEIDPGGMNGTVTSIHHHPRTVSFVSSTDASSADAAAAAAAAATAAAVKTGSISPGETRERRRNSSHRLTGILRRSVTPQRQRSTPVHETRKQCWMSPTASVSSLNFSGTPDFIPASLYRPSLHSTSQDVELVDDQQVTVVASAAYGVDRSQMGRANAGATTAAFSSTPPSMHVSAKGRLSEGSNDGRRSLLPAGDEGRYQQTKTMQSFDNENRLQQLTIDNHPATPPPHPSQPMHGSNRGRRDSDVGKNSGDARLTGPGELASTSQESSFIESVDPRLVYDVDIHRGSRGFGFSIRGGKEFNGMPLLVLDIAVGGPADMDGRMKNGDQILAINGFSTKDMTHERAIELIQNACSPISLAMKRTASTARRHSRRAKAGDRAQIKHP